ncbi:hypothetical protein ES703_11835 [subsurface metagenome]
MKLKMFNLLLNIFGLTIKKSVSEGSPRVITSLNFIVTYFMGQVAISSPNGIIY